MVLLPSHEMVLVVLGDPLRLQHDAEAWRHEQSLVNLVGKFVRALPPPG